MQSLGEAKILSDNLEEIKGGLTWLEKEDALKTLTPQIKNLTNQIDELTTALRKLNYSRNHLTRERDVVVKDAHKQFMSLHPKCKIFSLYPGIGSRNHVWTCDECGVAMTLHCK